MQHIFTHYLNSAIEILEKEEVQTASALGIIKPQQAGRNRNVGAFQILLYIVV